MSVKTAVLATALAACGEPPTENVVVAPSANEIAGVIVNDNGQDGSKEEVITISDDKAVLTNSDIAPSRFQVVDMEQFEGKMLLDLKADCLDNQRLFSHSQSEVVEVMAELLRRSDLADKSSDEILQVFATLR